MRIKVLLLGATGKLGRHVLQCLTAEGIYDVGVSVRNVNSFHNEKGIILFQGDISKKESLEQSIKWADILINCTGYVSYKSQESKRLYLANVDGVKNIVDLCVKHNKKLIHTSSTSIFGSTTQPIFFKENTYAENSYLTIYGETKKAAEEIVLSANIPKIILRPASLISKEKSALKILHDIYRKGYVAGFKGGGSFALIDDVAKTFIYAIKTLQSSHQVEDSVYNLGGSNITCAEIFSLFKTIERSDTKFLSSRVLFLISMLNDYLLNPVFNYSIITRQVYKMANHYNFIDSSKSIKDLNYKITPFHTAITKIL